MFALITKARKLHIPIDVQLELFDAVVTPVVLYGSEIWCYEGCEILEKLHLQFCKIILCLKNQRAMLWYMKNWEDIHYY